MAEDGEVFILLSGLSGVDEDVSPFKHWAIGIKLETGEWIRLEGLREGVTLKSSYSISTYEPSDKIVPANGIAVLCRSPDVVFRWQLMRCLCVFPVRYIRASPSQLRDIASSIPNSPYVPGVNDCQMWLIKAMVLLRQYKISYPFAESLRDLFFARPLLPSIPILIENPSLAIATQREAETDSFWSRLIDTITLGVRLIQENLLGAQERRAILLEQ